MRIARCDIVSFLWFYGLCLAVQLGGAYFTQTSVRDWYPTLELSPLNPPGPVFGVVWSILYVLMAWAACRMHAVERSVNNRPLRWWLIQLLLGLLWCIVFFGMRDILGGLIVIIATTFATIVMAVFFWRRDGLAGLLVTPLLLWLTLATHLNLYIYLHN